MTAPSGQKGRVVCVFCGSSAGKTDAHLTAARTLAHIFHKENITLVYGGGTAGIMGEIARTLVSLSGPESVQGVIPSALVKVEDGYRETLTAASTNPAAAAAAGKGDVSVDGAGKAPERIISGSESPSRVDAQYGVTTIVPDMHTRKRLMAEKVIAGGPGSGFVALAGGFGTIEEVMEMVTWNQLGIHHRGIVLLNIGGYWDGILEWVKRSVDEGFVSEANKDILVQCKTVEGVLEALDGYKLSEGRYMLQWEGTKEELKE